MSKSLYVAFVARNVRVTATILGRLKKKASVVINAKKVIKERRQYKEIQRIIDSW